LTFRDTAKEFVDAKIHKEKTTEQMVLNLFPLFMRPPC
jgi:hypothetical protein